MADVRLLEEAFDPGAALGSFSALPDAGGIVSFLGQVRGGGGDAGSVEAGSVEALELQHYAPLTLPAMQALAERALSRWVLGGLLVWHRVGVMTPGQPIVLVAAAARHRRDAFEAVDYIMDHLKSDSWFWKRELRDGQWHWIEPRDQDVADHARWGD
ncbi:MAG: molybdenum cofactor biosynthesis protein MoaE [Sphingomonadales bacterium]|nr:molybdenum cofactor biosynthesis protein MoaE [Sphingomonadales bacterium]MDE2169650.1 molybdenum cofactor biosynthesis protein MoaE [Sphingomonadales bacterium]